MSDKRYPNFEKLAETILSTSNPNAVMQALTVLLKPTINQADEGSNKS